MNVADAVYARRSIRRFAERPITDEELERLLELALIAPNHRMTQPCHFVVLGPEARRAFGRIKGEKRAGNIDDPEVAEKVLEKSIEEMAAIPAIVAFVQKLDDDADIREEDYATIYMGMQSFLLGAVEMGLGTHVKTGRELDGDATRDLLGIAEDERIVALVQVGVPDDIPDAKSRVGVDERVRRVP